MMLRVRLPLLIAGLLAVCFLATTAPKPAAAQSGDGSSLSGLSAFKSAKPKSGVKRKTTKRAEMVGEFIYTAATDGIVPAVRNAAGDIAETGIKTVGRRAVLAGSAKCAVAGAALGGPVGALLGFGACYAIGKFAVDEVADRVGDWIEGDDEDEARRGRFARREDPFPDGRPTGQAPGALGGGVIDGDVLISVFVDGPITTTARGSGAKATTNVGVANAGDTEVRVNVDGSVTTRAEGSGEARTDIGVATGEGARVVVNVDGTVTTIATGRAKASTQIGVASGEDSRVDAFVDGAVTTKATGGAESRTSIGLAAGDRSRVQVNADGSVTTIATGSATAVNEIGAAYGDGASAFVTVDGDVTATGKGRGRAENAIGVAQDGSVSVSVDGDVTATSGRGDAINNIGVGSGGTTSVGGNVTTMSSKGSAKTTIGGNGSAFVDGDVLNFGGKLSVGGAGACEKSRNGQCCLDTWRRFCVTRIVPKGKYGCPPRFIPVRGQCYYIPDRNHQFDD